jgi:hypothetical protein
MNPTSHPPIVFDGRTYYYGSNGYFAARKPCKQLHHAVFEKHTGKKVPSGFQVHHIDGNALNNSPDNLHALSASVHQTNHLLEQRKIMGHCKSCGETFSTTERSGRKWCSMRCQNKVTYMKLRLEVICEICSSKYLKNKWSTGRTCSKSCSKKLYYMEKKNDSKAG